MNDALWREPATLVRLSRGNDDTATEILFEGTLEQMTRRVTTFTRAERERIRISLPDRKVRPHTFEGPALITLIEQVKLERI